MSVLITTSSAYEPQKFHVKFTDIESPPTQCCGEFLIV